VHSYTSVAIASCWTYALQNARFFFLTTDTVAQLWRFAILGDAEHQEKPCTKRSLSIAKINKYTDFQRRRSTLTDTGGQLLILAILGYAGFYASRGIKL